MCVCVIPPNCFEHHKVRIKIAQLYTTFAITYFATNVANISR